MLDYVRKLIKDDNHDCSEFTKDECKLISHAWTKAVRQRRNTLKKIVKIEKEYVDTSDKRSLMKDYKRRIRQEIEDYCYEIIDLIDLQLWSETKEPNEKIAKIFWCKMKGDFYRYLAELYENAKTNTKHIENFERYSLLSHRSYKDAYW